MKEITIIDQVQAINQAYDKHLFENINLWLFGIVSLIGCYQPDDDEHPFYYFWKVEDNDKEHLIQYIGVFEQEKSFTEHCYNREIRPGDIFFWEDKVFCYYQFLNSKKIITPFGLINPEKLRQAFPPNHPLRDSKGKLFEAFDDKLNFAGRYWGFSTRYYERWFPILPQIYPDINDIEDVVVRQNSAQIFSACTVAFQYHAESLRVDTCRYRSLELSKKINDKLNALSDDGKKWLLSDGLSSFSELTPEDIGSLITEINACYGTDYQNDGSWETPQMLLNTLSRDLDKRIFV